MSNPNKEMPTPLKSAIYHKVSSALAVDLASKTSSFIDKACILSVGLEVLGEELKTNEALMEVYNKFSNSEDTQTIIEFTIDILHDKVMNLIEERLNEDE